MCTCYSDNHSSQVNTWCWHLQVLLLLPAGTLQHQAAVLSFATLVHKVCSARCAPETLDKYVGRYLDLFTGTWPNYEHVGQSLYLLPGTVPALLCCR